MSNKTYCPNCNGYSFDTPDGSYWHCFKCEYTKRNGTSDYIKVKGDIPTYRALYTELTTYYQKQLKKEHRAYLNKRGITDDTIEQYKIGYCSTKPTLLYKHPKAIESGIVTKNGYVVLQNRIVFPYLLGDRVTDIRGRLYQGEGERYLSLMGSTYFRGATFAYNVNTHASEIIITEGEIKALAACQLGYHCVGLPGILSRRCFTIIDTDKQYLCFDSQKDMRYVNRAMKTQLDRMYNAYVITLPIYDREKMDIDTFILSIGANSFHTLVRYAKKVH